MDGGQTILVKNANRFNIRNGDWLVRAKMELIDDQLYYVADARQYNGGLWGTAYNLGKVDLSTLTSPAPLFYQQVNNVVVSVTKFEAEKFFGVFRI